MDFRDKDGEPLIKWTTPRGRSRPWAGMTRGAGSATTAGSAYEKLARRPGHPVAVQREHPDGTRAALHRPRVQHGDDECETFGHDLETGAPVERTEYRRRPAGRAMLKAADYAPAARSRTKIPVLPDHRPRRLPLPHADQDGPRAELDAAAPDVLVELAPGTPAARDRRGRRRPGRVATGRDRCACSPLRHASGRRLSSLPLRIMGRRGS